jgi:hypothetical protein
MRLALDPVSHVCTAQVGSSARSGHCGAGGNIWRQVMLNCAKHRRESHRIVSSPQLQTAVPDRRAWTRTATVNNSNRAFTARLQISPLRAGHIVDHVFGKCMGQPPDGSSTTEIQSNLRMLNGAQVVLVGAHAARRHPSGVSVAVPSPADMVTFDRVRTGLNAACPDFRICSVCVITCAR